MLDRERTKHEPGLSPYSELRRQNVLSKAEQQRIRSEPPGIPYLFFQANLIALESQIADQVLAAHPKGYSTTRATFSETSSHRETRPSEPSCATCRLEVGSI
jgi:hypothetical protein